MSSTPQTAGFQLSVMPVQPNINPTLFNPLGAVSEGLDAGLRDRQILQELAIRKAQADREAAEAPLRMLNLDEQVRGNRLANIVAAAKAPYAGPEAQAQLLSARTAADVAAAQAPGKITMAGEPISSVKSSFLDTNENGDLEKWNIVEEIDPRTGQKSLHNYKVETVKTAAQIQREQEMADALNAYRANMGQAAGVRASAAQAAAEARAKYPNNVTRVVNDADGNQFLIVHDKAGNILKTEPITLGTNAQGQPNPAKRLMQPSAAQLIMGMGGAPAGPVAPVPPTPPAADTGFDITKIFSSPPATQYQTPDDVKAAVGKTLTRQQAAQILQDQFGYGP